MARRHLDAETLHRLAARDLDRSELQATGWHLYKCRRCRGRMRQALDDGETILTRLFAGLEPMDVYAGRDYGASFAGALRAVASRVEAHRGETSQAEDWLTTVLGLSAAERVRAVERHPERGSWPLAEGILAACRRRWTAEPAEAAELASLALRVIGTLRRRGASGELDQPLLADLTARAWAYLGNCRRIRSDLRSAAEAFERACRWIDRGSGDAAERARILDLHASLLRGQRRFDESDRALDTAIRLYRSVGDQRGVARALIKQAMTASYSNRPERAAELDRQALCMLDEQREPQLYMVAFFNLLQDLHEAERFAEAQPMLEEARRLTAAHGEPVELLRFRWFEGLFARDAGDTEEAEAILSQLRAAYVDRGNAYDAALVSLDLAVLYAEQGRTAETRRLAEQMLPIFQSREVGREALATLMLFQQAALAERLTATLAREVAVALRHGRSVVPLTNPPAPS